ASHGTAASGPRRLHSRSSRAALRGPWCAQIVRRQIAYVGSDQLRHGLLAGEPVPYFTLPHSKLLSESHFPPGDAPELALKLCGRHLASPGRLRACASIGTLMAPRLSASTSAAVAAA